MKKHSANSYDSRTNNVRQLYDSRTNSYWSYDSRKTVFRIRTAAVRIHKTAVRIRYLQICELCWDAAICLRFRSFGFWRKVLSHGWCKQGLTNSLNCRTHSYGCRANSLSTDLRIRKAHTIVVRLWDEHHRLSCDLCELCWNAPISLRSAAIGLRFICMFVLGFNVSLTLF